MKPLVVGAIVAATLTTACSYVPPHVLSIKSANYFNDFDRAQIRKAVDEWNAKVGVNLTFGEEASVGVFAAEECPYPKLPAPEIVGYTHTGMSMGESYASICLDENWLRPRFAADGTSYEQIAMQHEIGHLFELQHVPEKQRTMFIAVPDQPSHLGPELICQFAARWWGGDPRCLQ